MKCSFQSMQADYQWIDLHFLEMEESEKMRIDTVSPLLNIT